MKKLLQIILLTFAVLTPLNSEARVHYRGFVDFMPGITFYNDDDNYGGPFYYEDFGFRINTTHGLQINKLFVGLGLGVNSSAMYISAEFYARCRYDFINSSKWAPYIQADLGATADSEFGFLGSAAGGIRLKLSRLVGLNFGLSLNYCSHNIYWELNKSSYYGYNPSLTPALLIGLDF